MSARINILPHREERRKRARTHFAVLGAMTAALGLAILGSGWFVLSQRISAQEDRNKFLKAEIAKLDKEIDEIKEVKEKIAALRRGWEASGKSSSSDIWPRAPPNSAILLAF